MTELEHITKLAERLTASEKRQLVARLADRLRAESEPKRGTADLYGAWKGKFSEDLDVIAEIRGIRDGWKEKFASD